MAREYSWKPIVALAGVSAACMIAGIMSISIESTTSVYGAGSGNAPIVGGECDRLMMEKSEQIAGSITWDDEDNAAGIRPESVVVQLVDTDGNVAAEQETNAANGWTYDFSYVQLDADKTYYLAQKNNSSYAGEVRNWDIVNIYRQDSASVAVNIMWDDRDNQDGIRPTYANLTLDTEDMEGQTYKFSPEESWSHTFQYTPTLLNEDYKWKVSVGMDDSEDGDDQMRGLLEYTMEDIYDGNNVVGAYGEAQTITVVLSHKPYQTEIIFKHSWNGDEDNLNERPDNMIVDILADGEFFKSVNVVGDDSKEQPLGRYDRFKDGGVEIKYTLDNIRGVDASGNEYNINYDDNLDEANLTAVELEPVPYYKEQDGEEDAEHYIDREKYSVKYYDGIGNENGGQGKLMESIDCYDGDEIPRVTNVVRDKYEFSGWIDMTNAEGNDGKVHDNLIYKATWTPIRTFVIYSENVNGENILCFYKQAMDTPPVDGDNYNDRPITKIWEFDESKRFENWSMKEFYQSANESVDSAENVYWSKDYIRNVTVVTCHMDKYKIEPISMCGWFKNGTNITDINLDIFDTSKCESFFDTFYNCGKLDTDDLVKTAGKFDTRSATTMQGMFGFCNGVDDFDKIIQGYDFSQLVIAAHLFANCTGDTSIAFPYRCDNLISTEGMFGADHTPNPTLQYVDLRGFYAPNLDNVYAMFSYQKQLKRIYGIETLNVTSSNITNFGRLFAYCEKLSSNDTGARELNLTQWTFSKIGNNIAHSVDRMFLDAGAVSSLTVNLTSDALSHLKATPVEFENGSVTTQYAQMQEGANNVIIQEHDVYETQQSFSPSQYQEKIITLQTYASNNVRYSGWDCNWKTKEIAKRDSSHEVLLGDKVKKFNVSFTFKPVIGTSPTTPVQSLVMPAPDSTPAPKPLIGGIAATGDYAGIALISVSVIAATASVVLYVRRRRNLQ